MNWNSMKYEKKDTKEKSEENVPPSSDDFLNQLNKRFINQQDQIAKYRTILTVWFVCVTVAQLIVADVLIFIAIFVVKEMVELLDFLKYFVGATFVELLGGLLIIVKFVFSHETFDMIKHLTYVDPSAKE